MNPGRNTVSTNYGTAYGVLVNSVDAMYKPIGVTIDWDDVTALASPLSLDGGGTAPTGEKVIVAGTVLYRKSGNGKYAPAVTATTLVRGEVFITDRHCFQSLHSEQFGPVFDNGTVFESRIKSGGSLPSLANIKAAFPRLSFHKD